MKWALTILFFVGSSGAAIAETPAEAEAREHYRRGMQSYQLADFPRAIDEFKKSYELTQAPALLFNLAQASRLNKDPERALFYYQTYLRVVPRPPNLDDVEKLIAWCERERHGGAAVMAAAGGGVVVDASSSQLVAPRSMVLDDGHRRRRGLKVGAGITGSLGVAALAVGIALGVRADSFESEVTRTSKDEQPWSRQKDALYREGEREAAAATAMYVVGGVSLATGLVLAIASARKRAPRIEPTLARRPAVTLAWEF